MLYIKFPRFRIAVSYTEKYPDGFYWPEEEKSFLWFKYWSKFDINSNVAVQAMIDFDDQGKKNFNGSKEFATTLIAFRKQFIKEEAERKFHEEKEKREKARLGW